MSQEAVTPPGENLVTVSLDYTNQKDVDNTINMMAALIGYYTPPPYRHLNEEFFTRTKDLPVEEKVRQYQLELSTWVVSYHVTEAFKMKAEIEAMQAASKPAEEVKS